MGYRGKLEEQARARELRAQAWTLQEIADKLDVSKSSVSVWVRDVEFEAKPRKRVAQQKAFIHPLRKKRLQEIADLEASGRQRIAELSEREFLIAGAALYACEGSKTDQGEVRFANSDARMVWFFCVWLRRFFELEEDRMRLQLYLHDDQDLERANAFWSRVTRIPREQFRKPYRAVADSGYRSTKHLYGCPAVSYCSTTIHREIMGLARALVGPSSPGSLKPVDHLLAAANTLADPNARAW